MFMNGKSLFLLLFYLYSWVILMLTATVNRPNKYQSNDILFLINVNLMKVASQI